MLAGEGPASYTEALQEGRACLQRAPGPVTDAPQLEAQVLLAHVLGISRMAVMVHPERTLDAGPLARYRALIARRASGEPLPYLTGRTEFYGLDFAVSPAVLIPRSETELLVDLALERVRGWGIPVPHIVDVGTGSGCIAMTLAVHLPGARVLAVDCSPAALAVARGNATHHGVSGRVSLLQGDLLEPLQGPRSVDLIVSNPPYVARDEWDALPVSVREHEPRLALDGGPDGLHVLRRLLGQAGGVLSPGGVLLLEIGYRQGKAVLALARDAFPSADLRVHPDVGGRDRVLEVGL